jgi:DNA modification methylase
VTPRVDILVGDALDTLRSLPDRSVHCAVTSPPYFGLRSYLPPGHPDKTREVGAERKVQDYVDRLVSVLREVKRVLRDDGTLWLNLGDCYGPDKSLRGIPWRVAFALQADGWILRSDIVWHKPSPMPESVRDRPTRAHEFVFMLAKSTRYFFDADAVREPCVGGLGGGRQRAQARGEVREKRNPNGQPDGQGHNMYARDNPAGRNIRDVWTIGPKPFRGAHFATWTRVVQRTAMVIRKSARVEATGHREHTSGKMVSPARSETVGWAPGCQCGAPAVPCTVLDPFGGAGTTAVVAKKLNRSAILCELNPDYARLAAQRLGLVAGAPANAVGAEVSNG